MKKKIFFLTAKRGGYDAMKPLLKLIISKKKYELKIVITDQHLNKKFGETSKMVKKDFKNIISINSKQLSGANKDRNKSMSIIMNKLSYILDKQKPNLFLIYGDRCESLISAISCLNFAIPIAHFQGGDISGNIDEKFRHALTKLSDYHFVSNQLSLRRLIQMGESKKKIFLVGDNHIDSLKKVRPYKFKELQEKYNLFYEKRPIVFLMHPEKFSQQKNKENSFKVLNLLSKLGRDIICIYPCTDIGYEGIINSLNKFKNKKFFHIFPNIPYKDFISFIKLSLFMIGNSSSGIIESSYLKTKVINLGNRQKGRLHNNNVFHSDFNIGNISSIIKKLTKKTRPIKIKKNIYGNGDAYKKTYKIIDSIMRKKEIHIHKKFNLIKL
ncbi:MAG: UDP-N-acetylglucosamine 2-epimerase (hydrolyzing) [Candidatus Pelagibacter sp. TMED273]|nr:MAG: UDP-N-acetylglucosamine 2-epimerase (hydrolyzing) [Candidatus Pelagibacter sp. TMED273]|tara:strand:- start:7384 stop:8532 length:1149 start_codon:yes stop_codon:yes gene_type:complete